MPPKRKTSPKRKSASPARKSASPKKSGAKKSRAPMSASARKRATETRRKNSCVKKCMSPKPRRVRAAGSKSNPWIEHVQEYVAKHPAVSWKDALSLAAPSYRRA